MISEHISIPPDDCWQAWTPQELAARLQGVDRRWCVVGGWALDLWLGRQTRDHDDIELTVLRSDAGEFRSTFSDMRLFAASGGVLTHLAQDASLPDDLFQVWCFDPLMRVWRADMMIEDGDATNWFYKRNPEITRPRAEAWLRNPGGIDYLAPAIVLLFKAKYLRAKDEQDFQAVAPELPSTERRWLKQQLEWLHPGHRWIGALS